MKKLLKGFLKSPLGGSFGLCYLLGIRCLEQTMSIHKLIG